MKIRIGFSIKKLLPYKGSSPTRLQAVKVGSSELLKLLESSRDRARAKLRLINKLKHSSAIILVALTASLTVIVATHAAATLVAGPGLIVAWFELGSTMSLTKWSAQLDAAAKGTYILSRDLDTISRLVARLNDELEHMRATVRFWLERGGDRLQAGREVARQLKKNDLSFSEQLDELEEHLYLCFMTINRVIVATHAAATLVAGPGLIVAWFELGSTMSLTKWSAQLDAAAKGTYILSRDLDTISRLVARLNDELEHMRATVRFWLERGGDRLQAGREVARQLKKNDLSFSEQLDELEEHLYLCFMTINRGRNLVMKEILDPSRPITAQCLH
ncbi:unnamed protein product [Ilex paraguariensis]|uniref:Uncharacterized protein n=1 Tax=Ilex paraguariensis TaxID=185542 RepID=A0ABC8UVE7_9AQUA